MIAAALLLLTLLAEPMPDAAPIAIEFVAGPDDPVGEAAFTEALRARLPPDYAPTSVVVRVVAEEDGAYLLEIVPPDAEALRRRVRNPDPDAARRTLALLAAFALEHGEFPEGVGDEVVVTDADPDSDADADADADTDADSDADADPDPVVEPTLRVIGHLGAGALLATPTATARLPSVGGTAVFDLGLKIRRFAWTGMEVAYSGHPNAEVTAHRLAAGAFVGVLPRVGPVLLGARLGAVGGMIDGRALGDVARRGFVAGSLALGVDWVPPRGRGLLVGAWALLEVANRTATFVAPDRTIGFGYARPGLVLTLGWSSPAP